MLKTWPSLMPAAFAAASACRLASATARRIASSRTCAEEPWSVAWPVTVTPGMAPPGQHQIGNPQAIVAFEPPTAGQAIAALEAPGWAPDREARPATTTPVTAKTPSTTRRFDLILIAGHLVGRRFRFLTERRGGRFLVARRFWRNQGCSARLRGSHGADPSPAINVPDQGHCDPSADRRDRRPGDRDHLLHRSGRQPSLLHGACGQLDRPSGPEGHGRGDARGCAGDRFAGRF